MERDWKEDTKVREGIIMSVSLVYSDGHESPPNRPTGVDFYNGTLEFDVPEFNVPRGSTVVGAVLRSGSWEVGAKCNPETFKYSGGTYKFTSLAIDILPDRTMRITR